PLLPHQRLEPDTRHVFEVADGGPIEWVRLDAYPDGGLARVRLIGAVDAEARRLAGYRWFNALPDDQALACLGSAGLSETAAATVLDRRPLTGAYRWDRSVGPSPDEVSTLTRILEGRP
ncbi:hypothetical protein GHK86_09900, partial [Acidimicrobiaceae bacterium USS-CC1]|nr:hypothetical protein [Acidiferrimicrobium australe]